VKVLLISPRYAPAIGGVEMHVEMIARRLVTEGLVVEVATTDPTGVLPQTELLDGVLVRRFRTLANDATFVVSPALARWARKNVGQYDVVHAHSYHTPMPLIGAIATSGSRIPLVITPHYHGTGHTFGRRLLHPPYRVAAGWALRRAAAVICVSAAEKQALSSQFPGTRAVVIPNGIDVSELTPPTSDRSDNHSLLAVGRLEHYKGQASIIGAMQHLPPPWTLTLVGDGSQRASLERAIDLHGLQDRIFLSPWMSRPELVRSYQNAAVFVSMSLQEAFGITLLEAAAAGAAVVASDIPAHREVASLLPRSVVRLVPLDGSPARLAQEIELARGSGDAQAVSVTAPDWNGIAKETAALYASLSRPVARLHH
jgi:glycosyltransferase involved in cell wall biosynthesis